MVASPSSSSSLCPGCGKALDPLRAGHVAILDGGFRYFCGADCKATYVDVSSKRISLEALTAEPPPVMVVPVSGVRAHEEPPHFPEPEDDGAAPLRDQQVAKLQIHQIADAAAGEEEQMEDRIGSNVLA